MNNSAVAVTTCNQLLTSLPVEIPWFLVSELCVDAQYETDEFSRHFVKICCSNTSSTKPQIESKYEAVQNFVQVTCDDRNLNMSQELRNEICNMSLLENPFEISMFAYILLSFLLPIGLLANTLIITTVLRYKKMKNSTGYMLCNLAITDLVCILQMMAYLLVVGKSRIKQFSLLYYMFSSGDILIGSVSLLSITAITMERAYAVTKPFKYRNLMTRKLTFIIISSIWVFSLVLGIFSLVRYFIRTEIYEKTVFCISVSLSFILPCFIVILSYGRISMVAFKNIRMEKRLTNSIVTAFLSTKLLKKHKKSYVSREVKTTINIAIMTIPFVFGWGYFMTCNIYEAITHTVITGIGNWFLNTLPFLISCINPVSYIIFTRTLRQQSWRILQMAFCRCTLKQNKCSYSQSFSAIESTSCMERHV